ncbi:hypothetical protein OF83DRAFT_1126912 [Amylostereum chailletii]|nr:hypothetical protein OF83DRAFT_1126912 [Amylostereum chailletii]
MSRTPIRRTPTTLRASTNMNFKPSVKRITAPTSSQIADFATLTVRAMEGNDAASAMFGGDDSLSEEFFTAMIRATLLEGEVYVVEDEEAKTATLALWFRAPNRMFGSEAQRARGFNDFYEKLSPETKDWWTQTYTPTMTKWRRVFYTPEEEARTWYCSLIVTDPARQNQGFATLFMDEFYKNVRKGDDLLSLATTTDHNVAMYLSWGFKERGRITLESPINTFPVVWLAKE